MNGTGSNQPREWPVRVRIGGRNRSELRIPGFRRATNSV